MGAFLSLVVMIVVTHKFALERTAIYFQSMVYLGAIMWILYLSKHIKYLEIYKVIGLVLLLGLSIYLLKNIFPQIKDNARMYSEYKERELVIKNEIQKGLYHIKVKKIKTSSWSKFYLLRIYDLESSSDNWINYAAAKYYGLSTIITY